MFRTHYISEAKAEKGKVRIAGWAHDVRDLGKMRFVIMRDRTGLMQVIMKKGVVPDEMLSTPVNKEDVISFEGTVKESKMAPGGVELVPERMEVLNKVEVKLPVDPTDAVPSDFDTKIDYRYIDLRRKETNAVFSIKSVAAQAFREAVTGLGFEEIHPTSITGAATEGGTDVFELQYFERKAYLVQSPQLYKQLAVIGGFDRVYMTVPVFRAEKHNTPTHLNEIIQMDVEMGFADHNDAMDVLEKTVLHMLESIKERCADHLAALGTELKVPESIPRHTYSELVDKLNSHDYKMEWGQDFTKEAEKKLDEILGEELHFIYDWPTMVRAFYSMPKKDKPEVCNAFDLIYRGVEISSGAQRVHVPDIIEQQLKARDLDPKDFKFYIDAFRVGAPPHAGWSIGLERFTMKVANRANIRDCMLFPRDRTRLHP